MSDHSSSPLVTISVVDLLRFFDEKPDWSEKHATGIVSLVGEDLNAACFQHFLESRCARAAVLKVPGSRKPLPVTTGTRRGPRLDRWIEVDWPDGSKTVFQTEIKNWSAHAIGGEILAVPSTPEEVMNYKQVRWERQWDAQRQTLKHSYTGKVLVRMKSPVGVDGRSVRPLLIFWETIGPLDQEHNLLFKMSAPSCDLPYTLPGTWPSPCEFPELWVFSVSSYLRSIPDASLELEMPDTAHRLRLLNRLFPAGTCNL